MCRFSLRAAQSFPWRELLTALHHVTSITAEALEKNCSRKGQEKRPAPIEVTELDERAREKIAKNKVERVDVAPEAVCCLVLSDGERVGSTRAQGGTLVHA